MLARVAVDNLLDISLLYVFVNDCYLIFFNIFLICSCEFFFCLVWGEKVASAQDFGRQPKGEDHFKSWFPLFSCLLVTILYCSDIVWSKNLFVYFFCFFSIFDREFFFLILLSSNL